MRNYAELTVKELKDVARKMNLNGYSRLKKADLVTLIENHVSAKAEERRQVIESFKLEIGVVNFTKAKKFWKNLKGLKKFTLDDYSDMVDAWKTLKSAIMHDLEKCDTLKDLAISIAVIYGAEDEIDGMSDDELADFINTTLASFNLAVNTDILHKDVVDLKKFALSYLNFEEKIWFDSRLLFDPVKVAKMPEGGIPLLKTAEDGISRYLQETAQDSVSIETDHTEEEDVLVERLCKEGFYDIATGKHYYPAFQGASANRKATIGFVEVTGDTHEECVNQVVATWCAVTGCADWDALVKALTDKNGLCVMAKSVVRLATRASNSLSMEKIDSEMDKLIKSLNVAYPGDTETVVIQKIRQYNTATGAYTENDHFEHSIVDADGQGQASYEVFAMFSKALRIISGDDYIRFNTLWDAVGKDINKVREGSELDKLIKKMPPLFQFRHGEKKGTIVRNNLEKFVPGVDVIIPDSVRKFVGGEWSDYTFEVCNYLKPNHKEWAYLNPQFAGCLDNDDPDFLIPIAKHWFDYQVESFNKISKATAFHGMLTASDEEGNMVESLITKGVRMCSSLLTDRKIMKMREDQHRKFDDNMAISRLMVKGSYTYMIFDPNYSLNKWVEAGYLKFADGIDKLPVLADGEFYYNGKDCLAGLFRSPMIAPTEAQKVQLVAHECPVYRYLAGGVIFNGFDGTADKMAGADFDGDECLIVTDDNWFGSIVINSIRNKGYIVWEPAKSAQKVEFTWDNFVNYLISEGSKRDQTGVITNYGTKALDVANHFRNIIRYAKQYKCDTITFVHPRAYGKGLGWDADCSIQIVNGHNTFVTKALIEAKFTKKAKEFYAGKDFSPADIEPWQVYFPYDHQEGRGLVGEFSFADVEAEIEYYESINHVVEHLQSEEIDGAKTGFHPEIADFVKIAFTAQHMLNRQSVLGRDLSVSGKLNCYKSLSSIGRLFTYVEKVVKPEVAKHLENGTSKEWLLLDCLYPQEKEAIYKKYTMSNGLQLNLIELIGGMRDSKGKIVVPGMKSAYGTAMHNLKQLSDSDTKEERQRITEEEINKLRAYADAMGVTYEVMASAAYLATYAKNTHQNDGLSYAWLLENEILSVFSRSNKQYISLRLPANAQTCSIKGGVIYVNDKAYMRINAEDIDDVIVEHDKDTAFAFIKKNCATAVPAAQPQKVASGAVYTLTAAGFKFYETQNVEGWKKAVSENAYKFEVTVDDTDRPVMQVNGKTICGILNSSNVYELKGHTVKVVNRSAYAPNEDISFKENSIYNIKVVVID